jgi:hypothetical protein
MVSTITFIKQEYTFATRIPDGFVIADFRKSKAKGHLLIVFYPKEINL